MDLEKEEDKRRVETLTQWKFSHSQEIITPVMKSVCACVREINGSLILRQKDSVFLISRPWL